MAKVVTSIKIDDSLLRESKKLAIDRQTTFSELLEIALKHEMERYKNRRSTKS